MQNYILEKYNKLTIIKEVSPHIYPSWLKRRKFLCKCDCWNTKEILINHIKSWLTKSCWCLISNKLVWNINWLKHWLCKTKIYSIYRWILQRCNNKNYKWYKNYGWRWIKCEWETFEIFYKDMKDWYKEWLSIDRINNDWNYCKSNCRWATSKEQWNNRRSNHIIEYNWKKQTLQYWSEELWIKKTTLSIRLQRWWNIERALQIN